MKTNEVGGESIIVLT